MSKIPVVQSDNECVKCPRLVEYRRSIIPKAQFAEFCYHNAPVLPSGDPSAWLLIIGLAPGAHGANRTGVNFLGDGAGVLLYQALFECGLATRYNLYDSCPSDYLRGVMITNTVRCVPPKNKPTGKEFETCRSNLLELFREKKTITDILCIGADAWREIHNVFDCKPGKFSHGARRIMTPYTIYASFHTSTYNQNTGRINLSMLTGLIKCIIDWRERPKGAAIRLMGQKGG